MERNIRIGNVKQSAFTLIELLVVLLLISILASIVTPIVTKSIDRAKESTLKENLLVMRKALDDYYADKGTYPTELSALAEDKYIRKIPIDPITEQSDTWQTELSDSEEGESGIIDIHSGAQGTSIDGSAYSDW